MRRWIFTVVMAVAAGFVGTARAEHYDVFVLAGQSNMDGRAKVGELTGDLAKWKEAQVDVLLAYSNSGTKGKLLSTDGWVKLAPGYSVAPARPRQEKLPGGTFGPEIGFGKT